MKTLILTAASMVLGLTASVQASLITNGNFDTDLSGWTHLPWVNNSWGGTLWKTDQGGSAGIWGDGAEGGYLYQDNVSHPFASGETYDIDFSLATYGGGKPAVQVTLFDTTPAIPEAVASLTVQPPSYNATLAPFTFGYVVEPSRVGHTWRLDVNPLQWGGWVGVDAVSVTAVPEPTSAALLGTGLLSLFVRRNRR